jgi:hypothetical protein
VAHAISSFSEMQLGAKSIPVSGNRKVNSETKSLSSLKSLPGEFKNLTSSNVQNDCLWGVESLARISSIPVFSAVSAQRMSQNIGIAGISTKCSSARVAT